MRLEPKLLSDTGIIQQKILFKIINKSRNINMYGETRLQLCVYFMTIIHKIIKETV